MCLRGGVSTCLWMTMSCCVSVILVSVPSASLSCLGHTNHTKDQHPTDTTLDLSQKAEKGMSTFRGVWGQKEGVSGVFGGPMVGLRGHSTRRPLQCVCLSVSVVSLVSPSCLPRVSGVSLVSQVPQVSRGVGDVSRVLGVSLWCLGCLRCLAAVSR